MKIRYELTIDDIVAFNKHHCSASPAWRRQVRTQMLAAPVLFAGVFMCAYGVLSMMDRWDPYYWLLTLPLLLVAALCSFATRSTLNSTLEDNMRKTLAEGSNQLMLGWRELQLIEHRFVVSMELAWCSYDLRAIEKIVQTDRYTFVYLSSIQAIIIPMELYPEDDYEAFVDELHEAWENRELTARASNANVFAGPADDRVMKRRDN